MNYYYILGAILGVLAISQTPFIHSLPSYESAATLVSEYDAAVGGTRVSTDTIYRDMIIWWALPIIYIFLFTLASLLSFKRRRIYIIPICVALLIYILLFDYKLILDGPEMLYLALQTPSCRYFTCWYLYGLVVNYMVLPLALTTIPLLQLCSNKSLSQTGANNAPTG